MISIYIRKGYNMPMKKMTMKKKKTVKKPMAKKKTMSKVKMGY